MIIGIEATHANKPHRTGVEEYCARVINELKIILPSDVRVILYSNAFLTAELGVLPSNWEVKILPWPLKKGWSQVRLSWELWRRPPDVFFAPGQLLPLCCPANTVVTIHDSAFLSVPRAYGFLSGWYLRLMNRLIVKKAKKILVTARFNLAELKKYYGDDIEKKCAVIPLGFDTEYRSPTASSLFTAPYILSVGRLEEKKNTKRVVEAFNIVKARAGKENLKLVLAGETGVGYEEVAEAVRESRYKKDIILPGYVDANALKAVMQKAAVLVFPSLYEGFGLPVLEAMAAGCPVVASGTTALPETGGVAAEYVDPTSAEAIAQGITRLLDDPAYRSAKINAGYDNVKRFSWQKTARETADALQSCQNR